VLGQFSTAFDLGFIGSYIGIERNRGSVSALSAGAYTATLYVMVNIVKGCGRLHPQSSPAWDNFSVMI
jgi:hypothetical protein